MCGGNRAFNPAFSAVFLNLAEYWLTVSFGFCVILLYSICHLFRMDIVVNLSIILSAIFLRLPFLLQYARLSSSSSYHCAAGPSKRLAAIASWSSFLHLLAFAALSNFFTHSVGSSFSYPLYLGHWVMFLSLGPPCR